MAGVGWGSAGRVAEAIRRREMSAVEALAEQLDRIARVDSGLCSVVTVDAEAAQRRAEEADKALATGEVWGPLHGVGVTVEDVHATAGMRSTFGGSRPFATYVPDADATVVARLKAAGAIVVGKTNGPCFWGQDSVFPPTRNPWNADRVAGGSSTGPAVAVAAGLTPFDIAGDTRGSIQCPAAFCGVFGLRPTEHRVPLTGTIFIDPIRKFRVLATAGPMARSVGDLRLAMQVITGPDGRDPEVPPVPWQETAPVALTGLRVGYSPIYPSFVDAEIRAGTDTLAAELQDLGVTVEDRLPDPGLAEYGQVVEELWPMVVSAAEQQSPGSDEPSSAPLWNYLATLDRRDRFIASWERYFATYDAFIAPAMPMRAWRVDAREWRVDTGEPADDSPQAQAFVALLLSQVSGCPMVVIPVGIDANGVPFGIQLIARRWHDEHLLAIAEAITTVTDGSDNRLDFEATVHTASRRHSKRLTTQTSINARNTVGMRFGLS